MTTVLFKDTQQKTEQTAPALESVALKFTERHFVAILIAVTVLLASLPSLFGYAITISDHHFVGSVYDIDDTLVYYSWTRQAADGHFFLRNLFTTDHQQAIQFNLLFTLIGQIVRLTSIPIPIVFLIAKIIASIGLLALIYRLFLYLIPNNQVARLSAFFMVCLGNGFGWIFWLAGSDKNAVQDVAVDLWQPEALTFQSIEMSLLFTVSQILMVAVIFLLITGQRTGKMRYAVAAGFSALLLGNIHSYDILQLAAAWLLYLVVICIVERRFNPTIWLQALMCCVIGLPSPLYQYHMFMTDPVWHARVLVATTSPPFVCYVRGWGLVFVFAVLGLALLSARRFKDIPTLAPERSSIIVPICWLLGALIATYLPHSTFQRRMIMGADIPLSLLAGCGIAVLTSEFPRRKSIFIAALCCLATIPTALVWVWRDINYIIMDKSRAETTPFLDNDQIAALNWIKQNTKPNEAVLGEPTLMIFVPGWCDRYTFFSQWGETPNYGDKLRKFAFFVRDDMPKEQRKQYLATTKTDYFVFPRAKEGSTVQLSFGRSETLANFHAMPELLQPVYANKELTIYKVLVQSSAK